MVRGDAYDGTLDLETQGDVKVFRDVRFGPVGDVVVGFGDANVLDGFCFKRKKLVWVDA